MTIDSICTVRWSIGLPHNKPLWYVKSRRFVSQQIREQQVRVFADVFQLPQTQIIDLVNILSQDMKLNDAQVWRERGINVTGLEDRVTLAFLVMQLQPMIGIETGTSGGGSAAAILQSMEPYGGVLHSIDIETPFADEYGILIPDHLRPNWHLHIQSNTAILPQLLEKLEQIHFFYHDSVHTLQHMMWEYETAWPYITSGGILATHDTHFSSAFDDFGRRYRDDIATGGKIGAVGFWVKK